jgi:outer membrane lipoprotein-sorting protein
MFMQSKNPVFPVSGSVFFLCLVLLFSGGCAREPWTKPVDDNQAQTIRNMIQEKVKADAACSSTLDAEVTVSMKTVMETKSFSGFLQLKLPSSVKFVTTNPLGQTVLALVSDGQSYRTVNTLNTQFISGSLSTLALRNDIPQELLTGRWGIWLSDRIDIPKDTEITDIRQDATARGIWIKLANVKTKGEGPEYILVDPASKRPLLRMLMDAKENPIAMIEYADWQDGPKCGQPATFHITGLSKGVEISIHLADIITDKILTERDFTLRPPPGYFIELRP